MDIYSVLLISTDSYGKTYIKGLFTTFDKARDYILDEIESMLDDQDISWYRNHGNRRIESFQNDLDKNWVTKPFDIYKIEKHLVDH